MKKISLLVFILLLILFVFFVTQDSFASVIFEDNFNDSTESSFKWIRSGPQLFNGDNSQANWKFENGVVGMKIVNRGFQFNELIPVNWNSSQKDYQMEFDIKLVSGVDTNFVFRYQDHSNWYGVHGINNQFFLQKAGGNWSQIPGAKSVVFNSNQFYHFKVIVKEENMKVYINDTLMWDITDTGTHLTSGVPGLQASTGAVSSSEVIFDNFKIISLDSILPVPYFSQNDNPWGSTEYDHSLGLLDDPTMNRWGCAVTSASMVLNYHDIKSFGSEYENKNIDPGTLNEWLRNNGGYAFGRGKDGPYAYIYWNKVSELTKRLETIGKAPFSLEHKRLKSQSDSRVDEIIENLILNEKDPVILGVTNSQTKGHFIVATGITNNTWNINDPEWNYLTLESFNDDYYQADYYKPSHTDISYIVGVVNPDVHLLFVDGTGKKTGKIIENNQLIEYNEIPNASYSFEPPISNPNSSGQEETLGTGVNAFYLPQPAVGDYKVYVSSQDENSLYTLNLQLSEVNGQSTDTKQLGYTGNNSNDLLDIKYSSNSASITIKVVSYLSALADLEELWVAKQIKKKAVYIVLREELELAEKASKKKNGKAATKIALLLARKTLEKNKEHFTVDGYEIMKYDSEYLIENL